MFKIIRTNGMSVIIPVSRRSNGRLMCICAHTLPDAYKITYTTWSKVECIYTERERQLHQKPLFHYVSTALYHIVLMHDDQQLASVKDLFSIETKFVMMLAHVYSFYFALLHTHTEINERKLNEKSQTYVRVEAKQKWTNERTNKNERTNESIEQINKKRRNKLLSSRYDLRLCLLLSQVHSLLFLYRWISIITPYIVRNNLFADAICIRKFFLCFKVNKKKQNKSSTRKVSIDSLYYLPWLETIQWGLSVYLI